MSKLTSYHVLKNNKLITYFTLIGLTVEEAVFICECRQKGYAITSNKYRSANRVDCPNWREIMAKSHAPWDPEGDGMDWVRSLDQHGHSAADFYRRCHSSDEITIPVHLVKHIDKSASGPREYQE